MAYEPDFHYYAVYYVLRAKGYPTNRADELAGYSQYVDDNFFTEPLYCYAPTRAKFHFAGSGPDVATVRKCEEAKKNLTNGFAVYLAGKPEGKYVAGAALHLMADTFSHQTFTAWYNRKINYRTGSLRPCIGHADAEEDGHAPDRPYNSVSEAVEAARAIYEIVPTLTNGTSIVPWSAVQTNLQSVFSLDGLTRNDQSEIKVRVAMLKKLIHQQFGDVADYDKKRFAVNKDAFVQAVKY